MEERWTCLCAYFSPPIRTALEAVPLPKRDTVQELRLRAGGELTLSTASGEEHVGITVSAEQVQDCFLRLCGHAVHTHQAELAQGFITTTDGFRVGIAGTAVIKDGCVISYRDISSLCIRLSRVIVGCADPLLPIIDSEDGLRGLLLCGAPSSGKTTLLRDLARALGATRRVCVVDERAELSLGGLTGCDVLRGCPKAYGVLQAVRTLAPEVIVVDELGGEEDWQAVSKSCFCGVPLIASAHISSPEEVLARPSLVRLLQDGGFPLLAMLPGRDRAQDITRVWKAREFLEDVGRCAYRVRLRGSRDCGGVETAAASPDLESMGDTALPSARRTSLHGISNTGVAVLRQQRGSAGAWLAVGI